MGVRGATAATRLRVVTAFLLVLTAAGAAAAGAPSAGQNDVGLGGAARISGAFEGKIYELPENTPRLPDFSQLQPIGSIYTPTLDVAPRSFDQGFPGVTNRFEWFAIRYRGRLSLPAAGLYRFRTVSDDGIRLYVDDKLLIERDGWHAPAWDDSEIELASGSHCVAVEYFQGPAWGIALQLYMAPPGGDFAILDLRKYKAPSFSWLLHRGCGTRPFPWLELLLPLFLLPPGLWWLRRKRGERGQDRSRSQFRLSFPDIEDDRPGQLLRAYELAADAHGGDVADPRPRTRLRIEYIPTEGGAPSFDREFRLRVRRVDAADSPVPGAELFLNGRPVGGRLFMLSDDTATLEVRCEPRAEGWELVKGENGSSLREITAASFLVELESEDGKITAQSPQVTIVHGAPATIELANGPESVGVKLEDLTGINANTLELGMPVGVVHGGRFMWPSKQIVTLDAVDLPLGADRLLPSGLVAESEKDGNKPVPMGTAVLILFTVRDKAGNPIRLLEPDEHGYYQPSFWIRRYWGGGLRPFFVTPAGDIKDPEGTRWVAKPSVSSVLPLGTYGTLFVPASADFDLLNTTYFNITIGRVTGNRVEQLLEQQFQAIVEPTPFANKWARWLLSGDVEDLGTFGAELFISIIPIVGDGRDLVIHLSKELSSIKKVGVMDRLVAMLALAGLTLDIANILTAGGATPLDAAVAALKTTAKLLRHLANPKVMLDLWRGLAKSLGRETAALLASRAARAAEALAEELYKRLEQFLALVERGVVRNTSDAVAVLRRTFGDFEAFGEKVKPYLKDTQKMQQLLSLMGMALAAVQLKDILALFVKHGVDEVIDLLTALILMDEIEKKQLSEARRG